MIRAFVGVRIDPDMVDRICEIQSDLKKGLKGIRWVRRENLHFTLKFLGMIDEENLAPIAEALERAVRPAAPFVIRGRGLGVFPDIRRPRVLWVGLEGRGLERAANDVETALEPLGFARERRQFRPHLTIGRWRSPGQLSRGLEQEIDRWNDHDFGQSRIVEVVFFQSVLKPDGPVYSPLRVSRLGGQ